jgi:hypothetical protein
MPDMFHGHVVWLTAGQGGRRTGPPDSPFAGSAFVPPANAYTGIASFVLCDFDPAVSRSTATARWLTVPNAGIHEVRPGTVVVITEGPKPVGYFHVEGVTVTE